MSDHRNSLDRAASSYLRSALHQPIHWHEWGAEAFDLAAKEDKPILLDIGAVWCHWCHVMDRESYEDATLAKVINEHFIAVKVDRDERPDVDSRYQAAVSAMSGQGGWPLTAMLTPDGKPFFGGTYFPRDDRYGRPGFERVLLTMADVWKTRRAEALESASSVFDAIEHGETFAGRAGSLSLGIVDKLVKSAVKQFDPRYGGFGTQPKFPHPAAIDLLIDVAGRTGNEAARDAAIVTLERWRAEVCTTSLPEASIATRSMSAGLYRTSRKCYTTTPACSATTCMRSSRLWTLTQPAWHATLFAGSMTCMTDRERGGFYASQDADLSLDDDGDYFTWTRDEATAVLTPAEMAVAGPYLRYRRTGRHASQSGEERSASQAHHRRSRETRGVTAEEAEKELFSAKKKLLAARLLRPTPYIDKTIYTSWNALAISAYLDAAHVLDLEEPRKFGLKTLDRILSEGWDPKRGLAHVIAYSETTGGGQLVRRHVAGVLDDYAFLLHALIDAWECDGQPQILRRRRRDRRKHDRALL